MIGEHAINEAWKARGNQWANQVTDEGWQGFEEQLAIASRRLTAAWKAKPDLPFAANKMITVAMGQPDPERELRLWFDRATDACFDFMPAYMSLKWAYRPRWHGSHELMLAMGRAARETGRYDTFVPQVYHWILSDIVDESPDRTELMARNDLWRDAEPVTRGKLAHAQTEAERTHALSWGIYYAVLGHDYRTAAEFSRELKRPVLSNVDQCLYDTYGIRNFEWRGMLAVQEDPEAAETLRAAETDYWNHRLAAAKDGFGKLLQMPTVASEREAKDLVEQRLAAIDVERRLNTGEWVTLSESEHQLLWRNQDAVKFVPQANGVLYEKNCPSPSVYLTARVGLDFEMKLKLDNRFGPDESQFGCFLACRPGCAEYASVVCGQTSHIKTEQSRAALVKALDSTTENNPPVPVTLKPDSSVRLVCTEGSVTLWVDEVQIFTRVVQDVLELPLPHEKPDKPLHFVGLGSLHYPRGEGEIHAIEFRRLLPDGSGAKR